MPSESTDTRFASAERCSEAELQAQIQQVSQHPLVRELLEAMGAVALVLNEQRQQAEVLDRVFLHDQINMLQGLRGLSELLVQDSGERQIDPTLAAELQKLTTRICAATTLQRDLILLETGAYRVERCDLRAGALVAELRVVLGRELGASSQRLHWPETDPPWWLCTDSVLAQRVLLCMLKNATEAADADHDVLLEAQVKEGWLHWIVRNPGGMKPSVQDRIFQRHFSTKPGRGRGLGTYCMKLIGERTLGGKVGFDVRCDEVSFYFALPLVEGASA